MKQVKKPIKYAFEGVKVMHRQIKPEKLKEICEANGLEAVLTANTLNAHAKLDHLP